MNTLFYNRGQVVYLQKMYAAHSGVYMRHADSVDLRCSVEDLHGASTL